MSKRNRQMWVGVQTDELVGLLTGKYRMDLPDDAEIEYTRSGGMFNIVEFLVRSETYPELSTGFVIPMECKCLTVVEEEGATKC